MQPTSEIPEDVKAEMDLEARRLGVTPSRTPTLPEAVPEDVRAEIDHQARVTEAHAVGTLTDDGPPVADIEEPEPGA